MKPNRIFASKLFEVTFLQEDTGYLAQARDKIERAFEDEYSDPAGQLYTNVIAVGSVATVVRKLPFFDSKDKFHGLYLLADVSGTPGVRFRLISTAVTERGTADQSERLFDGEDADSWSVYQELRPAAYLTTPLPAAEIEFIGHTSDVDVLIVGWETKDDREDWGSMNP